MGFFLETGSTLCLNVSNTLLVKKERTVYVQKN